MTTEGSQECGGLPHIIAIVGSTAVGKSKLAMELATKLNAEIISADSRQVYRMLDIGTAKPSMSDRKLVRHHLIDLVDPDQQYSAGEFVQDASQALRSIGQVGKTALLVGGTGHYIRSLLDGLSIPRVPVDQERRDSIEARLASEGVTAVLKSIARVDPRTAARLDQRNPRRIVRAVEIIEATGRPIPTVVPNPLPALRLGLRMSRDRHYAIADRRVEKQFEAGLVDEMSAILSRGYEDSLPSLRGLAYGQVGDYLAGRMTYSETVKAYKLATHHLIRRQDTWFRKEREVQWLDVEDHALEDRVMELVDHHMSQLPAIT